MIQLIFRAKMSTTAHHAAAADPWKSVGLVPCVTRAMEIIGDVNLIIHAMGAGLCLTGMRTAWMDPSRGS